MYSAADLTERVCLQDGLASELEQKAKEIAELQTLIATAGEVAVHAQVKSSKAFVQATPSCDCSSIMTDSSSDCRRNMLLALQLWKQSLQAASKRRCLPKQMLRFWSKKLAWLQTRRSYASQKELLR